MPRGKRVRGKMVKRPDEVRELPEAVKRLQERLSAPRLRAAGTISSYSQTAERFLGWMENGADPTSSDVRRYFMARRHAGISERTLKKEFFHLQKLFQANAWAWGFTGEDTPVAEDEASSPYLEADDIKLLIRSQGKLGKPERFYLAVATTYGCRRIELAKLNKRDVTDVTILIRTAKHGRPVRHRIPGEIAPVIADHYPRPHEADALTKVFRRICDIAGFELPAGYGFHSIRRTLRTQLEFGLAKIDKPPSLVADFFGWAKASKGVVFGGAAMMGTYSHPEVMSDDPYFVDSLIYQVHPFLPVWKESLEKKRR